MSIDRSAELNAIERQLMNIEEQQRAQISMIEQFQKQLDSYEFRPLDLSLPSTKIKSIEENSKMSKVCPSLSFSQITSRCVCFSVENFDRKARRNQSEN